MCRLILIGIVISVDSSGLATVFLPLFTVIFIVYDCIGFLFLWVLGMGCVVLLWYSLNLLSIYLAIFSSLEMFSYSLSKVAGFPLSKVT